LFESCYEVTNKKIELRKMAAPPTAQEVQALRGRIAQLEAELTAANTVTHNKTFVGSCIGWQTWHGGIGTAQPNVGNAAPTAHQKAEVGFTKWKTENPGTKIISEEIIWHGLESKNVGSDVWMAPTCNILVKYRDS